MTSTLSLVDVIARLEAQVAFHQGMAPEERFGPAKVRAEVERHYRDVLRDRVDGRKVSAVLRHLTRRGRIHLVRRGRPHWEALYSRQKPAPGAG